MKYYVVAPEGCQENFDKADKYLTDGKKYQINNIGSEYSKCCGRAFGITADNGAELYCNELCCSHIGNRDWTILEEPDETSPKQPTKTVSECQAEMLCSFYHAISQAGGDVGSFNMDMTLRDIVGRLAQNGVRFTYNKSDKCNK